MKVTIEKPSIQPLLTKKKVAAYARVSVETELTEHSLANQINTYRDYIMSRPDWEFVGVFADEGITGTKTNRPGFQAMLKACEEGKINILLVKSISRFARNTVDLLNTVRRLKALGISIRFERENIDSMDESGELLLTLLASFAQEEARSVSENNKWTIRKRFEQGLDNQFALFGYKWNGSEFTVVPEQAEVVKQIFNDYLAGMTPDQIAKKCAGQDVLSIRGNRISYSLVWDILRLEKYRGDSLLQKTFNEDFLTKHNVKNTGELPMYYAEGTHPQIVDDETFDSVQEEIKRRAELGYLANQSLNFSCFTGKIVCACCGKTYRKRMTEMKHRTTKFYKWICGNKLKYGVSFCSSRNIPDRILHNLTAEVLGIEDFSKTQFDASISRILASNINTLTFEMKDGRSIEKSWQSNTRNTKIREALNGNISKIGSCN